MIGLANANALTASGMAAFAATELQFHGFHGDDEAVREAAAASVAPLLRAAAIALELSGVCTEDSGGGVHDVIVDYISVRTPAADPARVCVS